MDHAVIQKQRNNPLKIIQRIAKNDRTAVADCLDAYGNLIWAMARNLTDSSDDAENAVREIFLDIWRNAGRFESTNFNEITFITLLARRRLVKYLQ